MAISAKKIEQSPTWALYLRIPPPLGVSLGNRFPNSPFSFLTDHPLIRSPMVLLITLFQTSDGPTDRSTDGPSFLCHSLPDLRRTDRPNHRRSHFFMSPSARPKDRPTDPPTVPFSHVTLCQGPKDRPTEAPMVPFSYVTLCQGPMDRPTEAPMVAFSYIILS